MTDAAIAINGLEVRRGGRVILDAISLEVPAGSVTGLLGPSGSGKTTLMRAIVGVQEVALGGISVLGRPAGEPSLRSRVAYLTQAPSVYADLTVLENLRYFGAVAGAPGARVAEALATVGLERERSRLVATLSGGERSRVSLATALLGRPDLLVLDEPTTGLDPILRRELWGTFRALAAGGTTLLVSSHQMDEAGECDELLLMRDGRLLRQTTPAALLEETGASDMAGAFVTVIEAGLR